MPWWNVILLYAIRILSGTILSGLFGYYIVLSLEKTGVTRLYQSSTKKISIRYKDTVITLIIKKKVWDIIMF